MTLEYYKIFPDWEEELNMLDDAARGRLLSALMAYAFRGEKVTLTGEERLLYMPYCRAIDAAAQKSATNAANGAKGGKAKAQNKQTVADTVANCSDNVANDSEAVAECSPKSKSKSKSKSNISSPSNEGEGAKAPNAPARGRFTPPTAEEVAAYAQEKGLALDVERFVDFYASKGWKVGNASMRDWKAAVRNWSRDDKARGSPVRDCPPGQDDVYFYAKQLGWDNFTTQFARDFLRHYEARNWTLNGTALTDWRPLLKTWWDHPQRVTTETAYDPLPY